MKFILSLTRREIRSSWRRLLFFFLCIALGVGSIVFLRSLIQNLTKVVGNDARLLMTADLEVTSTNDFSPVEVAKVEDAIARHPDLVEARNETIVAATMARPVDQANESLAFIELKGIEPPFPLVGEFRLTDGSLFDYKLVANNGAVVGRALLDEMKVKVGDTLKIGEGEFEIRATFDEEPGGANGFRLGSRVFVEKNAFDTAGVTRNTSRVRRRILYRTADDPTPLVKDLRATLQGTTVQVNSYREQQENMSENFERTENYLSLTGLLILVLGGVGVWNVARAFVEQKRKTVAVLKCLGASGTRVITVYLLQVLTLGLLGSIFGVLLAQLGLWAARIKFLDALPAKMSYTIVGSTAWQGVILGVLISVLFSALPLLQIRTIKPRLLLRDENNANLSKLDRTRWIFGFACLAVLLGLAIWQAGSVKVGAFFLAGLAATGLVLFAAAWMLTWILRRVKGVTSFSFRQAINSLYRPGNQTRIVLLAVGLGAFVVIAVQTMQGNLVREFDLTRNSQLPSMIFGDIGRSQVDAVVSLIEERTGEKPQRVPTIRARIAAVNGEAIDYQNTEVRQNQGQIGREFLLTYRPQIEENETVVDGVWWQTTQPTDEPQVSVEENMARTLKVGAGDSMTFDVSGRKITARVLNVRRVDIRRGRTSFVFVFRPGSLEEAPQTFGASVLNRVPQQDRQKLQRDIIDAYPNVQIFDVADIVDTINKIVHNFVIAVSFVGSFVLLSGILILIGSVALTKSQRVYENAILKTLGANRRVLTTILISEYGLLGLLSGVIATTFAVTLSYAVTRYLLDVEWEFDWVTTVGGVVITTLLVMTVGTLAS
ncbi:MAG TPA: FtsX-like permease family protein, partial [Pyrinomonadaceae bacterium]|nr:FtsX-like permease family protein [Pyrinomonadaceae bacterium]